MGKINQAKIDKYVKIIQGFVLAQQGTPSPQAVLAHLLGAYPTSSLGNTLSTTFLGRKTLHHTTYVRKVKAALDALEVTSPNMKNIGVFLNHILSNKKVNKEGDLYSLLMAFFYYYNYCKYWVRTKTHQEFEGDIQAYQDLIDKKNEEMLKEADEFIPLPSSLKEVAIDATAIEQLGISAEQSSDEQALILIEILKDDQHKLCAAACNKLGELQITDGEIQKQAIDRLVAMSFHQDSNVSSCARRALTDFANKNEDVQIDIVKQLLVVAKKLSKSPIEYHQISGFNLLADKLQEFDITSPALFAELTQEAYDVLSNSAVNRQVHVPVFRLLNKIIVSDKKLLHDLVDKLLSFILPSMTIWDDSNDNVAQPAYVALLHLSKQLSLEDATAILITLEAKVDDYQNRNKKVNIINLITGLRKVVIQEDYAFDKVMQDKLCRDIVGVINQFRYTK